MLKRKDATAGGVLLKKGSQKFHNIQTPVTESFFLIKLQVTGTGFLL